MKHFSLVISILAVLATASAQTTTVRTAPSIDVKALYESHAQMASPFEKTATAKEGRSATASGPGENAKHVVLRLNTVFPQPGDRLVATLIVAEKLERNFVQVSGRHTVYEENTQQSRGEYFTPRVCGNPGWCYGGMGMFQSFEVYSTQISEADVVGDHALDIVLWDENGRLIQQVFAYYHVGRTSKFGRFYFRLEKAEVVSVQGGFAEISLSGQFPPNEEMMLVATNLTVGMGSIGPIASADGKSVKLKFGMGTAEIPMDFVVLFPGMRISSSLPNGVVLPQLLP